MMLLFKTCWSAVSSPEHSTNRRRQYTLLMNSDTLSSFSHRLLLGVVGNWNTGENLKHQSQFKGNILTLYVPPRGFLFTFFPCSRIELNYDYGRGQSSTGTSPWHPSSNPIPINLTALFSLETSNLWSWSPLSALFTSNLGFLTGVSFRESIYMQLDEL